MSTPRQVALLIEATNAYARGLLRGVARYTHERVRWTVYFEPHALDEPPPRWLSGWKGDGILARIGSRRMAKAVLAAGVPVVELRRIHSIAGVPCIGPDNQEVTRLGLEHLRERGFHQFGFCGFPRGLDPPMDGRAHAFLRHAQAAGLPCSLFPAERNSNWAQEQSRLVRWVRSLPKPAGIMTCNDGRGLQVLRACFQARIPVPDQVAVLGAGNDDCLCGLAHPPLSSIDLAPELIGYEAAALLDRLMAGARSASRPLLMAPRGIVTRLSTDVLATQDQTVAKAVALIRERACDGLRVGEVLRHVGLSRTALEPRLKRVLGRTVHQEISHVRIEHAKTLLSTTDLPTKQIAGRTGFRHVQYLTRVFHKATGQTPALYRRRTLNPAPVGP